MADKKYIAPFEGPLSEFPSSDEHPCGIKTVELSDSFGYTVEMTPDVVYALRDGKPLLLELLTPFRFGEKKKYPLVVFVQGSAWHRQPLFQHLQHMVRVCEKGYAAAIVQYRPSDEAPFPAQVKDAKAAIRFLRMNADRFGIDGDRVALWGESSGAHTALLAGFTADTELAEELYSDFSCAVGCIVDWYSPTDISTMNHFPSMQDHTAPDSPEGFLIGQKNVIDNPELVQPTKPTSYLSGENVVPPLLIMHGSRDQLVPFNQSCMLYEEMKRRSFEVEMVRLEGGYHAFGGFNSEQAIDISLEFIGRKIGKP